MNRLKRLLVCLLFLVGLVGLFVALNWPTSPVMQTASPSPPIQLRFDGHRLTVFNSKGQVLKSYPAKAGRWWTTLSDQDLKNAGPLPEGFYWVRTARHISILKTMTLIDVLKWLMRSPAWGLEGVPLDPFPNNKMYGRHSFYIHGGGWGLGSQGCIYLGFHNKDFQSSIQKIKDPIVLEVKYE